MYTYRHNFAANSCSSSSAASAFSTCARCGPDFIRTLAVLLLIFPLLPYVFFFVYLCACACACVRVCHTDASFYIHIHYHYICIYSHTLSLHMHIFTYIIITYAYIHIHYHCIIIYTHTLSLHMHIYTYIIITYACTYLLPASLLLSSNRRRSGRVPHLQLRVHRRADRTRRRRGWQGPRRRDPRAARKGCMPLE